MPYLLFDLCNTRQKLWETALSNSLEGQMVAHEQWRVYKLAPQFTLLWENKNLTSWLITFLFCSYCCLTSPLEVSLYWGNQGFEVSGPSGRPSIKHMILSDTHCILVNEIFRYPKYSVWIQNMLILYLLSILFLHHCCPAFIRNVQSNNWACGFPHQTRPRKSALWTKVCLL
jgi:hypothetical protein